VSCAFEVNDGAYILGALSPAERAEFEGHLATCPPCRESVASLAVLPGLLGRLDPATGGPRLGALGLQATASPPELLPRLLTAAGAQRRAQRRRNLLTTAAAAVVAAVVATAIGIGGSLFGRTPEATITAPVEQMTFTAMQPAGQYGGVAAEIGLRPEATGTVVEVRCLYHGKNQGNWPIWLVVFPRTQEEAEAIGSWVANPGAEVNVTAVTHYAPAEIARIELQTSNSTTLAYWSP
jgi:hypothetical protein